MTGRGDSPGGLAARAGRLHRVQDGAIHLAVAEVRHRVVFEVLHEGLADNDRLGVIQQIGESFGSTFDVADEAATQGIPDERDEHSAS